MQTQIETSPAPQPQGGRNQFFYGWLIVLAAALTTFITGPGQAYVFSVFIDPILLDTSISRTEFSFIYSVSTIFGAGVAWVVSVQVVRFGPRFMLGLTALAFGGACFGLGWATNGIGFFSGFTLLIALGQGSLPLIATLLTVQWFNRYRGRALALAYLGFPVSNAIFPLLTHWLINLTGWQNAYRVLGALAWLLILPAAIFVVRDRPEEMGLQPDGLPATVTELEKVGHLVISAWQPWWSWSFWRVALALATVPFTLTTLILHQLSIFAEHNLSADTATGIFVIISVSAVCMTLVGSFILERVQPKTVLMTDLGLLILSILFLLFTHELFGAVVYSLLLGSAMGLLPVTAGVIWVYYYGRANAGVYQGAASVLLMSLPAFGPVLLAALHQLAGDYTTGLLVLAGLLLLSGGVLANLRLDKK